MNFVYILRSAIKKYIYIGITNNLNRRFSQHNLGREVTTRPYRPFDLVHVESFANRSDARLREKYLKSGIGKEWIKSKYPYKV